MFFFKFRLWVDGNIAQTIYCIDTPVENTHPQVVLILTATKVFSRD